MEEIKNTILQAIPDAEVHVANPGNDGQHFEAVVISSQFEDLSLVKQQQMVMKALKVKFQESVHALALKTFTPSKWQSVKHEYNL